MATPPTFSAGAVLTAAQMNRAALWKSVPTISGTGVSVSTNGTVTFASVGTGGGKINDCFTDDFRNYKILISNITTSGSTYIYFQLMVGGTPNATASSYVRRGAITAGGALSYSADATTFYGFGNIDTTSSAFITVEMSNPKIASPTVWNSTMTESDGDWGSWGGRHTQSTAYDGLFLAPNAGTLNCTVQVYGYTQ